MRPHRRASESREGGRGAFLTRFLGPIAYFFSTVETRFLSGGNQQKVVLGRWLEANVKVLLLNEPTWGVDVGARSDIYDQLEMLAEQGLAILMVSSDIQEVLSVSHRILTMYKGQLTGEFSQREATEETLLHAAAGGTL